MLLYAFVILFKFLIFLNVYTKYLYIYSMYILAFLSLRLLP